MNEGLHGFQPVKPVLLLALLLVASSVLAQTVPTLNLPAGVTSTEIQSALDQLTGGGEVVLAPGVYEVRQPIVLQRDGQTLRGSGPATVLMLSDKANCPVIMLGAALVSPARATTHLRVSDLSIDGNRESQQVETWGVAVDGSVLNNNGIDVWNVSDTTIERVAAFRCRSGGLVAAAGTRRLSVTDFTAYDNQFDGLACYLTEDSRFTRLFLHDNLGAGISVDLAFNQNSIEDAVLSDNDLGVFMRYARGNNFKNVTVRNSRHHGIFMAQVVAKTEKGWELAPGTECVGNNFAHLDITHCGGRAFLVNNSTCVNNVVTDTHFAANAQDILAAQSGNKGVGVP